MTEKRKKLEITEDSTITDVVKYISELTLVEKNLLKSKSKTNRSFKYNEFAEIFLKECISGQVFFNLGCKELYELGIVEFEKQNALANHIELIRNEHQKKKPGIQYTPSKSTISTIPKIFDDIDFEQNIQQNVQNDTFDMFNNFFDDNTDCDLPSIPNEYNPTITTGTSIGKNQNLVNFDNQYISTAYPTEIIGNNVYQYNNRNNNNNYHQYQLNQSNQLNHLNQFNQLRNGYIQSSNCNNYNQNLCGMNQFYVFNEFNQVDQFNQLNFQKHNIGQNTKNYRACSPNYIIHSIPPIISSVGINNQPIIPNNDNNKSNSNDNNSLNLDFNLNDDLLNKMSIGIQQIQLNPLNLSNSIVQIPGIYQGINSHHIAFMVMTNHNIKQLNEVYEKIEKIQNKNNSSFQHENNQNNEKKSEKKLVKKKCRDCNTCNQPFICNIKTEKLRYGWMLDLKSDSESELASKTKLVKYVSKVKEKSNENAKVKVKSKPKSKLKIPFNPLILFTLNIVTDEIIDIELMKIKGSINHVNNLGQTWVTSDMEVQAIERASVASIATGNIIQLKLNDISHRSLQQRDASYLIHDPEKINSQQNGSYKKEPILLWKKGNDVTFHLKLSTRTNKKYGRKQKPVYVQAFNVKSVGE